MFDRVLRILREEVDGEIGSEDVEIVPDRQIPNLFAVRIGEQADYLVNEGTASVEKVRFDEWPPR